MQWKECSIKYAKTRHSIDIMDDLYPKQSHALQLVSVFQFMCSYTVCEQFIIPIGGIQSHEERKFTVSWYEQSSICSSQGLTGKLDDINAGNAYYDYYDKFIDCSNNVIVPLMLFADGMRIDEKWMHLSRAMDVYSCHIQMCY